MRCPLAKDPDTILDWIASIEIRASERAYPGTLVAGSRCTAKSTRTDRSYGRRPRIRHGQKSRWQSRRRYGPGQVALAGAIWLVTANNVSAWRQSVA